MSKKSFFKKREVTLLDFPVNLIEKIGGGSVRCMVAELH